jgi:large subunit ribosomal protein L17
MINNLVTSLMEHGRIRTTQARAKELRKVADRIITLSKRVPLASLEGLEGEELRVARANRVHAIRMARRWITDRDVLQKVFSEYSARFQTRPGGYTRILKLGSRPGDQAAMVLIELVEAYVAPEAAAPEADVSASA